MDPIHTLAMTLGIAWASGINLYAAVFMLGYLGMTGNIHLPPDLAVLSDPLVLAAAGFMYCVEFFADKTPGVDSGWDAIHTFIRIPAGAILAAGAIGEVSPAAQLAAGLIGGSIAAGSHFTKAGSRVLINTSPEPVTNWMASIGEDVAVFAGLWAALHHPVLFLVLLALFIALMIWLLPRLLRAMRTLFGFIARRYGGKSAGTPAPPSPSNSQPPQLNRGDPLR